MDRYTLIRLEKSFFVYSVVTLFALQLQKDIVNILNLCKVKGFYSQIPREIDIEAMHDCQVITQELQGDDVDDTL